MTPAGRKLSPCSTMLNAVGLSPDVVKTRLSIER